MRGRWLVIAILGGLSLTIAPGVQHLETDNSPEGFFVEDHAGLERFRQLERDFGRDRGVRLVIEGDGLWTRRGLAWVAALEAHSAVTGGGPGGVYGVAGPLRYHRWHLLSWPPADPEAFRLLLLSDPVDRALGWVSRDGDVVTLSAGLFKLQPERLERTLSDLEAMLPSDGSGRARAVGRVAERSSDRSGVTGPPPGTRGFLTGLPVVGREFDRAQARLFRRVVPALLLVAAALLGVAFWSVSGVVLPLLLVAVVFAVLFGSMGYAGEHLDIILSLLVPLVFAITLATAVHVVAYHRRLVVGGQPPARAVVETYRVKAWPALWTGLTTCVGFASLTVSPEPRVRALGLWTAFGIAFLTLAVLSLLPALLAVFAGRGRARSGSPLLRTGSSMEGWIGRRARSWARAAVSRPKAVYTVFAAVALLAVAGMPRMEVEGNPLTYLPPEHPVRRQVQRLEDAGVGPVSASLVLDLDGTGGTFSRSEPLRRLLALSAELRREPLITGVVSAGDLVADHARLDPAPVSGTDLLATTWTRMTHTPEHARRLSFLSTSDAGRTRLLLFTPMRGYRELEPLYGRAEAAARRIFPAADVWVSGEYPLILAAQRSLLRTIVASLTVTFLVIMTLLAWLLRSPSLAVRAMLPNLWPVVLVLGVMGWMGLPLDSTTVMVAAVVLGLAVDDTLHTVGHLRMRVASGAGAARRKALVGDCLGEVASGHVTSSFILCLGFAVAAGSELLPVARFGALSALAVAGALAADLALVPALLSAVPEHLLERLAPRG